MRYQLYPATERGTKDIGWLRSKFTFSFSDYRNPLRSGFGLLRAFNDDVVQPKGGFGLHPHHNMEIISILLEGRMNHRDSMGHNDEVGPGFVQIMSAGSGLRHEEWNVGDGPVNFLQIWIEPKVQNIPPRYQRRLFPLEVRTDRMLTVVSPSAGNDHCWINQDARIMVGHFTRKQELRIPCSTEHHALFLFVTEGTASIDDHDLGARDAIGAWELDALPVTVDPRSGLVAIEVPINA